MCALPPPPPPLPQPLITRSFRGTETKTQHKTQSNLREDTTCEWASNFVELRETCRKNQICMEIEPYKFVYRHFESILQIGPTCGLVALSMMLNGELSSDKLLQLARTEGCSNNGEIFSCKFMEKLIKKVLILSEIDNVEVTIHKDLSSSFTIQKLLSKAILLVPYDADFNHSPCLKKGHKAHWALVCGIIITKKPTICDFSTNNVYILSKHGKSRHLSIWPLDELAKSNENLWEFSSNREDDNLTYILPEGGISGENGLRSQFIIIEGI